jgi:hypothetical protein
MRGVCPKCSEVLHSSLARHEASGTCFRNANRGLIARQARQRRNEKRRAAYRRLKFPRSAIRAEICPEEKCSICMQHFQDPMTATQYAHAFCTECLLCVFSTQGDSSRCPLCRAFLNLFPANAEGPIQQQASDQPPAVAQIQQYSGDHDTYSSTSEEADDRDGDNTDD